MTMFGGSLGCFVALVLVFGVGGFLIFRGGTGGKGPEQQQTEVKDGGVDVGGKEKQSQGETWASPDKTAQLGDIRVRIVETTIGEVPLVGLGRETGASKDHHLIIRVELANTSSTKKLEYNSWSGADIAFGRDYATLRDNFDNNYKRITFGPFSRPVGAVERHESIYPGKSVGDVLVFEPPFDRATYLNLEMPAKNYGGEGMIRFRLPVKGISKTKG
jgi:hypothetical protein